MDILAPLIVMVIVYLVPKLWNKVWENIQKNYLVNKGIPRKMQDRDMAEQRELSFVNQESATYTPSNVAHHPPVAMTTVSGPAGVEEKAVWRGKMDANAVINGMIFAEIVQPPRAYRPFVKRK